MATTTSLYRDARAFAQAGKNSPFRSDDVETRRAAAEHMITHRQHELLALQVALSQATTAKARKHLKLRIQATTNNLKAWQEYFDGSADFEPAHRESRAVMTPRISPNPLLAF